MVPRRECSYTPVVSLVVALVLVGPGSLFASAERPMLQQVAVEHSGHFAQPTQAHVQETEAHTPGLPALPVNPRSMSMLLRLAATQSIKAWQAGRGKDVPKLLQLLEQKVRGAHLAADVADLVGRAAKESQKTGARKAVLELLRVAERRAKDGRKRLVQKHRPHIDSPGSVSQGQQQFESQRPAGRTSSPQQPHQQPLHWVPAGSTTNSLNLMNVATPSAEKKTSLLGRLFNFMGQPTENTIAQPVEQTAGQQNTAEAGTAAQPEEARATPNEKAVEQTAGQQNTAEADTVAQPEVAIAVPHKSVAVEAFKGVQHGSANVKKAMAGMQQGLTSVKSNVKAVKSAMGTYDQSIETLAQTLDEANTAAKEWAKKTFDHFESLESWRTQPFTEGYQAVDQKELDKFEKMVANQDPDPEPAEKEKPAGTEEVAPAPLVNQQVEKPAAQAVAPEVSSKLPAEKPAAQAVAPEVSSKLPAEKPAETQAVAPEVSSKLPAENKPAAQAEAPEVSSNQPAEEAAVGATTGTDLAETARTGRASAPGAAASVGPRYSTGDLSAILEYLGKAQDN